MAGTCWCTRPGCGKSFPGVDVPEHDPECTAWYDAIAKARDELDRENKRSLIDEFD